MPDGLEIEKKFKVKRLPENLGQYEKKVMEQGYLCTDPVVRIRRSNDQYILTYKSLFGVEEAECGAKVCREIEMPLKKEGYEHLKKKTDGNLITKTRYLIPLETKQGCFRAELDIFEGELSGLVIAEVEFPDRETAAGFEPPEWFGEDVSQDKRYTNNYLATRLDRKDFFKIISG